jgi:hypothetical protein
MARSTRNSWALQWDIGKTTQVLTGQEIGDAIPCEKNPVRGVCEGHETLGRRLDFPVTSSILMCCSS